MTRTPRIYTRTGDKGMTGLASGERISKDSLRIETYGTVDELNSFVGVCRQHTDTLPLAEGARVDAWLAALQNDLFNLGSDLATPIASRWDGIILIGEEEVTLLEKLIDICQNECPPLRQFVLPGGTKLNAYLHVARTVCRRAERLVVSLGKEETLNPNAVIFLNRLSDFFFALSRWVQVKSKKSEVTWSQQGGLKSFANKEL